MVLLFHEEKGLGHKTADHPFQDPTRWSLREDGCIPGIRRWPDKEIQPQQCPVNIDEVLLTFDIPMNRIIDSKGTSRKTGHEKVSFKVVLGKKLPPMVIFKRKTAIKDKFWLIAYTGKQNKLVSHMSLWPMVCAFKIPTEMNIKGETAVSVDKMIDMMTRTAKIHQVTSSTCPTPNSFYRVY